MALRIAAICGMVAAIAVPAIAARGGMEEDGLLMGRIIHLPIGAGLELHWSWPIFCVATLAIWALLAAARDR